MPPDRIGPYRLEGRLGSGGMGVVHAAWDERLERRVAVKQIRPEVAGDPLRRERFRREARAVAKLNHPAIVQIYDLLETSEGDWLVLQYVEGPTLAQRLRQGPLPPEQVVSLARDVLGALEEAHSQGFLHRDLKAENVVLTPSGRAKVLDFGLAKLYETGSRAGSGALTTAGGLVGTYRAMSPEQANGLELDPRSDLFSVGVLLYEAATGVSPFKAGTPVETLTRVCTHLQPPASELNPAIAEPLSALIDELLEKEPERRPRSASEALGRLSGLGTGASGSAPATRHTVVANTPPPRGSEELGRTLSSPSYRTYHPSRRLVVFAALSLIVVAALFFGWRARQLREPLYVAAARPELGAGGEREEVALAATALHAALLRGLSSLAGVAALSPEAAEAAPSARQLARLLAADEVLTSSLDCQERQCLAMLRRFDGKDGRLLAVQSFEVPLDDLHLLDTAAGTSLRTVFEGFHIRSENPNLQVRGEDYERFLALLRTWEEERPADLGPLLAGLERVRAGSPLFLDAYFLEATLAGRRFFETREEADLDRALGLVAQARALAPENPQPLITLFKIALLAERPDVAEEALRELEKRMPGDVWTLHRRAFLSESRGDGRKALEMLRAAVERRPSARFLMDLANLEMRQGEIPAARETLEDLLRRFPGHPGGEKLLAQLELEAGDPARAAELYGSLVRRRPGFPELSNLGVAQLLLGRHAEAAASLRRAFTQAPRSAAAALNLADAEMLLGRRAEAESLYRRVLELVARDPAPAFWQNLSIKAQALAHLGLAAEAAAAIQQAVSAAPQNPQLAYEASLVYAVIGDRASARASAERALAGGFDRRWFSFPWFDPLREDPAFRDRLRSGSAAR